MDGTFAAATHSDVDSMSHLPLRHFREKMGTKSSNHLQIHASFYVENTQMWCFSAVYVIYFAHEGSWGENIAYTSLPNATCNKNGPLIVAHLRT